MNPKYWKPTPTFLGQKALLFLSLLCNDYPYLTVYDGSASSSPPIKGLPCQQGDDSQCAEARSSLVELPEDILHHIHSLMLLRDAACAACVSRGFLRSWRCYPKLILDIHTLGINENASQGEIARKFVSRVDNILQNHTGRGLKIFKLSTYSCLNLHPGHVSRWLQVGITPGIEEFALQITQRSDTEYNFPCSLLSSEGGVSLQSIFFRGCSLHSVVQVGSMSSLTSVNLSFLSNSCSREKLYLSYCCEIICLEIPCLLLQLNLLEVMECKMLKRIDSSAPNLSAFYYYGSAIDISLGASLELRIVWMDSSCESGMLYYASTRLPSIAPNIEMLYLETQDEKVDTPVVLGRFIQLKFLEIALSAPNCSPSYDFCSLVSFLDASPSLETFILRVIYPVIRHDSVLDDPNGDPLRPRHLSGHCHGKLKLRDVMVTGFCSAKSMIELTRHIMEKAPSLERLTLDTTVGYDRRYVKSSRCLAMTKGALVEAEKACLAIRRCVEPWVPSTVTLKIIEPCSECHISKP